MPLDLSIDPSSLLSVIAYHDRTHGGGDNTSSLSLLLIVLGLAATAGWFIFSELRWRNTVLTAVAGWVIGLGMLFVL